jgi:hypothetical protein
MKRFATLAAAAVLVTGVSATATAQGLSTAALMGRPPLAGHMSSRTSLAQPGKGLQAPERRPILGNPSFALMLGGLFLNALSAPEGADSEAGFMVRFQTTVPTATRFLVGVAGLQWAPNGTESNTDANAAQFFLGPVLLSPAEWTQGWLLFGVDLLWLYGFGGGDREDVEDPNTKLYGNDLAAEFVVVVPFGSKMMPTMIEAFSGMSFVGLVSQRLTNLGEDPDRFAPALLAYLSIPLAPLSAAP